MSGGEFDYYQHYIMDIAERLEFLLERQGKEVEEEDRCNIPNYYVDHPEEAHYEYYSPIVQEKVKEGIDILKRAFIYAQRIDWFLSGDDGEDSFLRQLEEDLKANGINK